MKHRGHPIRGAIAGLFFGLFVSLDLVIFGVVALDADILAVIPILGLAAGIALGLAAPLHRRSPATEVEAQPAEPQPAGPRLAETQPAQASPALATTEPDHSAV